MTIHIVMSFQNKQKLTKCLFILHSFTGEDAEKRKEAVVEMYKTSWANEWKFIRMKESRKEDPKVNFNGTRLEIDFAKEELPKNFFNVYLGSEPVLN